MATVISPPPEMMAAILAEEKARALKDKKKAKDAPDHECAACEPVKAVDTPPGIILTMACMSLPNIDTVTVEDILANFMFMDAETLAVWGGAPHQVLCAQFLSYVKHAYKSRLREELSSTNVVFKRCEAAIARAPHKKG